MSNVSSESILHTLVSLLSTPTQLCLFAASAIALLEIGIVAGEWWRGRGSGHDSSPSVVDVEKLARRRVERADTLARVGPMLGLMGTLIPLGPGLAALGQGDLNTLARAVTVAFDTTVLGLAVGIVGYIVGKVRRRHYDTLLDRLEAQHGS